MAGNLRRSCPLVRNKEGRLRVLSLRVFTEAGREILLEDDDTLHAGVRHEYDIRALAAKPGDHARVRGELPPCGM